MENRQREIIVKAQDCVPFHNNVDGCVGTGRMGLALQKEYLDQLKLVQDVIGFQHIRGHGLFNEDMAIYQEYKDAEGNRRAEYNFTYLDLVMDSYRSLGLKPFLELGFMPGKIASAEQTIFYWKGNTTPPADYADWCALVRATLKHLMERYGQSEVLTWPIEVWNEPNLPGFWKGADMQEYFRLFKETFLAIKDLHPAFQVGGPAICGVQDEFWIRSFLEFCRAEGLKPDFITRHHYTIDLPVWEGHYGYPKLMEPEAGFANLQTTRDITDSFEEFRGLPIHITEFNSSYSPDTPLHDTNQNAAYLAQQLSRLGDVNESYSYWTFGDIFEEKGVPFAPFHGGFGLVANGCIPKPTFWTFAFFKQLKEAAGPAQAGPGTGLLTADLPVPAQAEAVCVHRSDDCVIVRRAEGGKCSCEKPGQPGGDGCPSENTEYRGVAWNSSLTRQGGTLELDFELPAEEGTEEYVLVTQTVDEDTCNPLKLWHDLGEPSSLAPWQKKLMQDEAKPFIQSRRLKKEGDTVRFGLAVKEFGVVYFKLMPVRQVSDRGFDYERAIGVI